jgi:hypothetical protein
MRGMEMLFELFIAKMAQNFKTINLKHFAVVERSFPL